MSGRKRIPGWMRLVGRWVVLLGGGYVVLCTVVYFLQRRMQYFPDRSELSLPGGSSFRGIEDVTFRSGDGVRLRGWYWPGERTATLVIFHGNAGHRGHRLDWMADLHRLGYGVFLFDYRGYGGSEGSPSEDGLYRDGDAAIDWLAGRGVNELVYVGESLGGGVALAMAVRRPPAALIVQSGFSSLVDVASSHYPYLPVNLLLKDRYDNTDKIGGLRCPLLVIHGERDNIVPTRFGKALHEKAPQPKELLLIRGVGHNDLLVHGSGEYYLAVERFLERHLQAGK